MADRNFPSVRIMNFQRDGVVIEGHFSVSGGAITANSRFGNGWTVAYTNVGRYTVTTDETFRHVVAADCQFVATAPTDRFLAPAVPGGGAGAQVTWEIDLWDVSAPGLTDPAAATDEIHFRMLMSTSISDRAAW